MMQFTKRSKIAAVRVGILTSLSLSAILFAIGPVSADPSKYRSTRVKPILVLAAADDFRAPPTKPGSVDMNADLATSDDFRAPPSDSIETASTALAKDCSGTTYNTCGPDK
jgi:hypothetical protein